MSTRDPHDAPGDDGVWDDDDAWVDDPEPGSDGPPPIPGRRAPRGSTSYRTAFRGVDFGTVISETFRQFAGAFFPLFGFGLLFFSGLIAVGLYASQMRVEPDDPKFIAIFLLTVIASGLGSALLSCVASHHVYHRMTGSRRSVAESLGPGLSRLGWVLLLNLIVGIAFIVGLILLIIPGIFVVVVTSVSLAACVVERAGPFEAIQRSTDLTKGSRWTIVGLGFLLGLVQGVVGVPIGLAQEMGGEGVRLIAAIAEVLTATVFGVFTAVGSTVLYVHLRRAHGEDPGREMVAVFD